MHALSFFVLHAQIVLKNMSKIWEIYIKEWPCNSSWALFPFALKFILSPNSKPIIMRKLDKGPLPSRKFLAFTNKLKTAFKNRKWNYFSYFLSSNRSFTKCLKLLPMSPKLVLETGNGIISPTSWAPIKKLLLQNVFNLS